MVLNKFRVNFLTRYRTNNPNAFIHPMVIDTPLNCLTLTAITVTGRRTELDLKDPRLDEPLARLDVGDHRAHGHSDLQRVARGALQQGVDMLRLQGSGTHAPEAEGLKLVCDQTEHALAVALGSVAAVAVAPAQLFQLVVQVAHSVLELW